MYACFSNTGNWDNQAIGYIGHVSGEQCILKGYAQAFNEFIIDHLNADGALCSPGFIDAELVVHDVTTEREWYDKICEENEFSLYFEGGPMFFVCVPSDECTDTMFMFVKL